MCVCQVITIHLFTKKALKSIEVQDHGGHNIIEVQDHGGRDRGNRQPELLQPRFLQHYRGGQSKSDNFASMTTPCLVLPHFSHTHSYPPHFEEVGENSFEVGFA